MSDVEAAAERPTCSGANSTNQSQRAQEATEEELQSSLSVLATLSDSKQHEYQDSLLRTTTSANDSVIDLIWNCLTQTTSRRQVDGELTAQKSDDKDLSTLMPELQPWVKEWNRIGSLICCRRRGEGDLSPFQIHAIASQALQFVDNADHSSAPSFSTGGIFFGATCLMICSYALSLCGQEQPVKYVKRWKSLLFETMQHFQRRFIRYADDHDDDDNDPSNTDNFTWLNSAATLLACQYVIPNLYRVRRALLLQSSPKPNFTTTPNTNTKIAAADKENNNDPNLAASTVAGAIAILTQLVRQIHCCGKGKSSSSIQPEKLVEVYKVLETICWIMGDSLDLIWCHVWRNKERARKRRAMASFEDETRTFQSALSLWSCWRQDMDEEVEEQCADYVCYVNTIWDTVGVAITAAYGFETPQNPFRPLVWHSTFAWNVFFPHVSILLEQEEYVQCQRLAFQLMRALLDATPVASLSLAATFTLGNHNYNYDVDSSQTNSSSLWTWSEKDGKPTHPTMQTLQLLSNHILRMTSVASAKNNNFQKETADTTTQSITLQSLPDGAACFAGFMKPLLSKYIPINQVLLVQHLVRTCPQHGLKPKLLDLLRSFVYWDNDGGQEAAWNYLDKQWGVIMETCFPSKTATATTTNSPPSTNQSGWDPMVDHVELSVSLLSIVRLWFLVHNKNDGKTAVWPRLRNRLEHLQAEPLQRLQASLQANLLRWTKPAMVENHDDDVTQSNSVNSRPSEYHRLNLLESALEQTIPFLLSPDLGVA